MTIDCSDADNETLINESIQTLSLGLLGFSLTLGVGLVGIVNNLILLFIFYRLKWFGRQHLILFWNLAIVDLLVCLSTVVIYSYSISKIISKTSDIQSQLSCEGKYVIFYLVCAVSGRFAFAIAVDRLMGKIFPYGWIRYEKRFRWGAVIVIWVWGTFARAVNLAITPADECVIACLGCVSYPHNWWYTCLTVANVTVSCFVILIYIVLPVLAALRLKSCFNQVLSGGLIFNYDKLQKQQKHFLVRLRVMSVVYIFCFLCTFTPATTLCDVIIPRTFTYNTEMTTVFLAISDVCFVLNSVLPLYLWLLFDASFRRQFVVLIVKLVCMVFTKRQRLDSMSSNSSQSPPNHICIDDDPKVYLVKVSQTLKF